MSESGREALPHVREWSAGPPGCSGVVGRPFGMYRSGWETFQMSGSGQEASWMSGSGRLALLDVREWSGGPPECTGVVGRPSGCPGVVGRPSQISGKGWLALPFRTLLRSPRTVLDDKMAPPSSFGRSRGVPEPFWTLPRHPRNVSDAPKAPRMESDTLEAPPSHFRRSRGTLRWNLTLSRPLRAVMDATLVPPGSFGLSRDAPGPFQMLPRCHQTVSHAPKMSPGHFGHS